jgi:hypothetical protein
MGALIALLLAMASWLIAWPLNAEAAAERNGALFLRSTIFLKRAPTLSFFSSLRNTTPDTPYVSLGGQIYSFRSFTVHPCHPALIASSCVGSHGCGGCSRDPLKSSACCISWQMMMCMWPVYENQVILLFLCYLYALWDEWWRLYSSSLLLKNEYDTVGDVYTLYYL